MTCDDDTSSQYTIHPYHILSRTVPDLLFSNPAGAGFCRIWYDKSDPEPDFQIDCNFTNLMCKTLQTYE